MFDLTQKSYFSVRAKNCLSNKQTNRFPIHFDLSNKQLFGTWKLFDPINKKTNEQTNKRNYFSII